jgi:thiamine transport system permease protein
LAFLGVFFAWPLVEILSRGLVDVGPREVADVLGRPSIRRVVWFSIRQAVGSLLLTLVVGLPLAHGLARYRFRGRRVLRALIVVPFVLPTLVVASSFDALFELVGVESLDHSLTAILLAHIFFNVAVVVRVVGGFWGTLDPRTVEAARVLGAGPWKAFRAVTLPQLAPVLAGASLLIFLFSFTSFGIVLVLGGPTRATVETETYRYAISRGELDTAAVLAIAQLVMVGLLAAGVTWMQRRFGFAERTRSVDHGLVVAGVRRRLHLAALLGLASVVLGLPLAALVMRSLEVPGGVGLANFRGLWSNSFNLPASPATGLAHSLQFALAAAAIAGVVGLVAARGVATGGLGGRLLEWLAVVPLGTSAVTLGLGYLLAFTVLDFRRSVWLVPVAHAVIGLPFVLGSVVPALRRLDPRLSEAASVLGAAPARRFSAVEWPLIRRAFFTGLGFVMAVSVGEFGATSFLTRGKDSFTAPIAIFSLVTRPGEGRVGQAMALSVVIGAVVAVLALVIELGRNESPTVL